MSMVKKLLDRSSDFVDMLDDIGIEVSSVSVYYFGSKPEISITLRDSSQSWDAWHFMNTEPARVKDIDYLWRSLVVEDAEIDEDVEITIFGDFYDVP